MLQFNSTSVALSFNKLHFKLLRKSLQECAKDLNGHIQSPPSPLPNVTQRSISIANKYDTKQKPKETLEVCGTRPPVTRSLGSFRSRSLSRAVLGRNPVYEPSRTRQNVEQQEKLDEEKVSPQKIVSLTEPRQLEPDELQHIYVGTLVEAQKALNIAEEGVQQYNPVIYPPEGSKFKIFAVKSEKTAALDHADQLQMQAKVLRMTRYSQRLDIELQQMEERVSQQPNPSTSLRNPEKITDSIKTMFDQNIRHQNDI